MTVYENFCRKYDKGNMDAQFYLDGIAEEHGEIFGVIKRVRRGDYDVFYRPEDYKPSAFIKKYGIEKTVAKYYKIEHDLTLEIGDHHWYLTRLLQKLSLSWELVEDKNMEKLETRLDNDEIIGREATVDPRPQTRRSRLPPQTRLDGR